MQNNTGKFSIMKLPFTSKLIVVSIILMNIAVCVLLSHTWETRLDYSFGYLTPIFALYIIYDRFPQAHIILSSKSIPDNKTLTLFCNGLFSSILIFSLILFTFFTLVYHNTITWGVPGFGTAFGFVFASISLIYFFSENNFKGEKLDIYTRLKFLSLFIFPCFIWLVSAPIFSSTEKAISLFLLSKVAAVVVSVMDWLGFVVNLQGNTISFPGGTVGVADACSGIRSLTACLFAGSFLAAALLNKLWKKIMLVMLSMFFAFLFNLVRALFLTLWAYENGAESISGFVHDAAGYFVLGMTVVGLLIFTTLFNINPIPPEYRNKQGNEK
ncbi:MAG: exosortase/archaeosortase family protein [Verrucomicrobiaceae bacterium]|nr:exosortase/archaeosortase family protein [Verrucomicrobiaceae bacterium]